MRSDATSGFSVFGVASSPTRRVSVAGAAFAGMRRAAATERAAASASERFSDVLL